MSTERKWRAVAVVALLVLALPACNDSPSSPTPPPPPPGPIAYNIAVTVLSPSGQGIAGAMLEIVQGQGTGQTFTCGGDGRITLTGAEGNLRIEATATGFRSQRLNVGPPATAGATQPLTFNLEPRGDYFAAGQYRVGTDIQPDRYYSDPVSGCYWERQSGLGGGLSDVIANDFVGFDSMQSIVDILPSDVAFETNAECGTWVDRPRHGPQTDIAPGTWLVGNQISPGTYRATVRSGCYWERVRSFTGEFNAIIANDFVGSSGPQLVTISPGDRGFYTNDDCGTWTRTGGAGENIAAEGASNRGDLPRSWAEIERNRALNRAQEGWRR